MTSQRKSAERAPGAEYVKAFGRLHQRTTDYSRPAPSAQLLPLLDGVKKIGAGRWIAKCPAHYDKRPSLSIRELDDERLLVHDFGGCGTSEVLAAVGLRFSDLYPDRPETQGHRERKPWLADAVLACLATEATIVAVAAGTLAQGDHLSDKDRARVMEAAGRLGEGARIARGLAA